MSKFLLTVCAFALAIAPCAVQAQSVVLSAPTIACDTPAGVGCSGRTVLRPGTYSLGGAHNLSGIATCHIRCEN
jgi:hypothetical protein